MSGERHIHLTQGAPAPVRMHLTRTGPMTGWDVAIVIPAKDENRRILACLNAVAVAISHAAPSSVGLVLVVNNTRDDTATRALSWGKAQDTLPCILVDCVFAPQDAGVGAARRLGLDLACHQLQPDGALLTTDADSHVRPDWIAQNLAELHHADLICGTVLGCPKEARHLPPAISAHGSAEWDYMTTAIHLAARLDPQPHDPAPRHHNPAGASMAFSRRVYEAVGRLPVQPIGEDRAFADRVLAHDYRVKFSDKPVVQASVRMTGRTEGGMAGALRARAFENDPYVDEWLEAAETFALRYTLQGRLRRCWPDTIAMHACLALMLGQHDADDLISSLDQRYFGACFQHIETRVTGLSRQKLRLSDCRRNLPHLQKRLWDELASTPPQSELATGPPALRNGPFL